VNGLERVLAAVRGEPTDRRAFSLVLSLYGAGLTGCPLSAYYAQPEAYLAGQRAVVDLCDPDILFAPFALSLEARAFGCELLHVATAPPIVRKPACPGLAGLASLRRPDPAADPGLFYLVEATRRLAAAFGREKAIAAVLTAPTDLPALLVGIDEWLDALLFDPQARDALVALAAGHFVALANALLAAGAHCVVTPVVFANPRIITPDLAREHMAPLLAEAYAQVRGPVIFHHGGNPLGGFLELFKDLPNVAGFALDSRDSFAEARRVLGPGPALLGNLSGPGLQGKSSRDCGQGARRILDERRDDPRFIFCTAHADVPLDTPPDNILAVRQAVLETAGDGA